MGGYSIVEPLFRGAQWLVAKAADVMGSALHEVNSPAVEAWRTNWMWFIFPQLAGLGHSAVAQHYAMRDLDQAKRYLADPLLGSRLCQDARLVMGAKTSRR